MYKPSPLPESEAKTLNQVQRDKVARLVYQLLAEEVGKEKSRCEGWEVHYVGPEGLLVYLPEKGQYGDPMTRVHLNTKIPW